MRTIKELSQINGNVYVYLSTKEIARKFLEAAESEGFTFKDGEKPTNRETDDIFRINPDKTINYVGYIGHMMFKSSIKTTSENKIIRVDFERFFTEKSNYFL